MSASTRPGPWGFAASLRVAGVALLALVMLAVGCGADGPAYDHPAIQAVSELLEMRRDDVRDAEAYAPYFLESSIATALAAPSDVPTGTPRVPEWERPYVSAETTTGVDVAVVWKADDAFPDWPAVNLFRMQVSGEKWVVTDALEATSAPAPIE